MAEKSLTAIPRDLRLLFNRANEAVQRQNFDYAIALFQQILEREPGLFECRRALRNAQLNKAGGRGGFFKRILSGASFSPLLGRGQIALRKGPLEAIAIAEQILNGDPHNSHAHKLLAEAALAAEMPRTAALSLEIVVKHAPKDKALAMQFAKALGRAGEQVRAEKILTDLQGTHPNDLEIAQALKDLSARRTLDEGGYEALADGTGSYRDILRNEQEAVSLEQEKRVVKTEDVAERLIAEYEARLQNEPHNLKLIRSLAELYTQKKRFAEALAYYDRIRASQGGTDPSLDRNIAETIVRRYDHELSQLDPNAADFAAQSAKIQAEKQAYQLEECRKRAERFPTDLQIRFEMGQVYYEAGKFNEAIQEFQKAQANPHRHIQALYHLGQCFASKGINDLAARTLQNALKEKLIFDEEKKELLYALGCVLDKMGKRDEAIEQFKLIYEQDIGYKDVAAKIDAYYSAQG